MQLDGMHHITMITGAAPANVAFYAELLGLRMVKKTVNFDAPEAYHLYFGDEQGTPGSILTWFEFAGARRGRPGQGMIHTLQLGVDSPASLEFWAERLTASGHSVERADAAVAFADHDGLRFELIVAGDGN
ncbi:MAG TPA: VOC family protein, partial [Solirubrobacteraceae bacterium]|nr:VOC family protein [Solirubrobacteraceae bacterium]